MTTVFEVIRDQIQVTELAQRFTDLKPCGRHLKGRCPLPDHDDSTPSFYVYRDGRAHCFGCGFHGDVVDLWATLRGIGTPIEALRDLAREYNVRLPERDREASKESEARREKETVFLKQATSFHQALALNPHVADWWRRRGFADELQKEFLLGSDRAGKAAVIPFWHRGRIQGLIRRQLDREPKYLLPKVEEFTDGYRPLFVIALNGDDYHLVEGYVDALSLVALGMNAIAVGGTGISDKQKGELEKIPGKFYAFPDNDDEGTKASRKWSTEFYPRLLLCPSEYGEGRKDPADLFAAEGENSYELLKALKARAINALDLALSEAPTRSAREQHEYVKLRILPLLVQHEDRGEREAAVTDVAKTLKLKLSELRRLVNSALAEDRADGQNPEGSQAPAPGSERYDKATRLLRSPNLVERVATEIEHLGHLGDHKAKQLAFICAISARSGHPIQPSTHAHSAAGKNFLWDRVLDFLPPEIVIRRSGMSAKALFRTQANLKGAVLYIQEVTGSESADYSIRVLQSDGRLEYEATERMPNGSFCNVVHSTEGPAVIVQTTTRSHLHPENETRVFPIYIDESEEQTDRIIKGLLKEAAQGAVAPNDKEAILVVWRDAIRLLEPADVIIPFAERIRIPTSAIRARRDAGRVLDVVRVLAWLHQHGRDRDASGRIIAAEEDFTTAVNLTSESLERAWKTLAPAEQKVLEVIRALPENKQLQGFKRRDLEVKGVSDRRLKEILKSLGESGYLDSDGAKGPQGFTYTLAREQEGLPFGIHLVPSPNPD